MAKQAPDSLLGKHAPAGVVEIGAGGAGDVVVVMRGFAVRGVPGCDVDVLLWRAADGDELPPHAPSVSPASMATARNHVRLAMAPWTSPMRDDEACIRLIHRATSPESLHATSTRVKELRGMH
jgi:hypothetical protein